VFTRYYSNQIFQSFTYKMSAKSSWHKYGTKLRHGHPIYTVDQKSKLLILSEYVNKTDKIGEM